MIILASASPRRKALMARLGQPFQVRPSGVPEDDIGGSPLEVVHLLARRKAQAAPAAGTDVVVGADTVLDVDGKILGKPENARHAVEMLQALRGRWHSVLTGLAVRHQGQCRVSSVETRVRMRAFSEQEILDYVDTGEPLDKAGAYAIQELGGALIESIEGCFLNVVGLPLCELGRLLRRQGIPIATGICHDPDGRPCPWDTTQAEAEASQP